jgi:hypothetical protein
MEAAAHGRVRRCREETSMPAKKSAAGDASLRHHLLDLLTGSNAHANFDAAVNDLPATLRGRRPKGAEHSPWEILEHLRIAQWDILDFSRNPKYKERPWPSGYWPAGAAPPTPQAWEKSVRAFQKDLKTFCALLSDPGTDLYAKIPHGSGQTILREALLIADHNAYHVGELVLVRRLLGAWK